MAIKYVPRFNEYVGLSTDDKTVIAQDNNIVYYTDTKKREIYSGGVWSEYVLNTDTSLTTGDLQIGAVEIKNSTDDTRAGVSTNGLHVDIKNIDADVTLSSSISISDGGNLDAFGRLRTSNPTTLFDTQFQYGDQPLFWDTQLTGGASSTPLPNESSIRLRCGTSSGDKVIRQSKCYIRYQPGKSQRVLLTGVIGAKKTGVRQRIGYFENNNGLFFEQDASNLKVVRRTNVSSTPTDNAVNQSDWNIDTLDGNGASGINLNTSKTQIFVIDLQWLGVGRVRFGFVVDGKLYYCHELLNTNNLSTVYMTTANLPIRYEIENTSGTASNTDMIQICASVQSEGGFEDDRGVTRSSGNGITALACTTRRPIFSVRPKATFNAITNRGIIIPLAYELFAQTNSCYFEVVVNGTLTGANFTSVGDNSIADYDISASAISGGEVIATGFCVASASTRSSIESVIRNRLTLCNDYAGTTPDRITVVATSFTGTSNVSASLDWKELY